MNLDLIHSVLLNCGRLFFTVWTIILVSVGIVVFRSDLS
jgi:hypothetical protein